MNSGGRERSADGVVTDFPVMQVRGHRVAGLVPENHFSSLRVVEVVKDVGLITCESEVAPLWKELHNSRH